ncbi:MAG: MFS transporter, partial [Candidatus Korarchaeota archaeon]|nr:MFS transporter [Candidatus Korarchaeota archaeon]
FWILWMTMFTVMFAEYLTNSPVPFLLEEFLVKEAAVVAMIGYLDSVYSLASTAIRIPSGILADKLERSVIILVSLCLLPTSYLLLLFATDSWWVLVAVIIYGVFEGLSMPSFDSVVADLAPESRRAMVFAIYSFSWIVSGMLAPAVGGFLSDEFFLRFPFILAFLMSIMGLLIYLGCLKGLKRHTSTYQTRTVKPNGIAASPTNSFKETLSLLCGMQFFNGLGNGI